MLVLGEKINRIGLAIPRVMLTESVPGKVYDLQIQIQGKATNEVELAKTLMAGLYSKFKAKVVYMAISDNTVEIQFEGSPFAWSAVIAYLPSIFTIFGIILIGISVYTVFASIPSWAWGLLAIGTIMLLVSPAVAKWI